VQFDYTIVRQHRQLFAEGPDIRSIWSGPETVVNRLTGDFCIGASSCGDALTGTGESGKALVASTAHTCLPRPPVGEGAFREECSVKNFLRPAPKGRGGA
jgi:hypothetical protein